MVKNTVNLEKAQKILDYWYAIEFLAQETYDDMWEIRAKMQKAQKDFSAGKFKGKTIWSYRELQSGQTIYDTILMEANSCGMTRWGNITIYIGKMKREACIECIADILPKEEEEERPEKAYDQIAWASLQITSNGTYVDHSLSLSTIIWSMNQLKNSKGRLSESIDAKAYHETVERIEKKFLSKGHGKNQKAEKESLQLDESEEDACSSEAAYAKEPAYFEEFAPDAVTEKDLKDLFKYIEQHFLKENIELTEAGNEYQEVYGLHFQLFKDVASRSRMEEDNYLGLSHDYYSEDIKYVHQKIKDHSITSEGYMSDDLLHYISALNEEHQSNKINLVSPENKTIFFRQISEILEVGNAPLGKWPSRFMPALMQQTAINLCIRKGTSQLYGVYGNVFSVNGPPGTGKTTLLKEIVVNNIIERAILLSEYKDPDDAFEKHSFLHGGKEEKAYSSYTRGWYSLKNDRINDYSTLVTSCNNAAVENISKELPIGTSIMKDLKPAPDDTEEYAAMLDEVSRLFDPAQSEIHEIIQGESHKDIYFTEYSKELFDDNIAWGLVAAPMGKKSNISTFYNRVLYSMYWDFYPNKDFKNKRIKNYECARSDFEKQLEVVQDLQIQLKDICALVYKYTEALIKYKELERKLPEKQSESELLKNAEMQYIEKQNLILNQKVNEMQIAAEKRDKAAGDVFETEQQAKTRLAEKRELLEKEVATRAKTGILDKWFNKKKMAANELLANTYHEDAIEAGTENERLMALLCELKGALEAAQKDLDAVEEVKRQTESNIADSKDKIRKVEDQMQEFESNLERIKTELDDRKTDYRKKVEEFTQNKSLDAGLVLDESFTDSLLSQDIEKSTFAQTANPWFTKHYNIERAKLFYYAMILNKEFVLSSKSCRDNFKTLGHYWGKLQGDDKETVVFHREDKERFAGAVYQTLFLLVPVLSSTFASLGTFLRDVKQAGVIGTLVVDEAGQAQPQMAVGALYRSRKAMIVGDPKQVEPVVTDDLKLLKRAFDEEELKSYKSKIVSVQSFADQLNSFGTWLDNGTDYPDWVGCPLLVHRRCISPMYDISNEISYNGIMKQQTREPDMETAASFVYEKSQWLNVMGKEKGNKNHFVEEQARKVCEMLEIAFLKSDAPSLYIISPFTSVVNGTKTYIKEYKRKTINTNLSKCDPEWMKKNIGTVHTFQGKEANEVIFLLGCDKSRDAEGAIRWVNTNIINVAVTRAKFRLYIIGDDAAWQKSACVKKAKTILDTFAIKKIKAIMEEQLPKEEETKALVMASASLPPIASFLERAAVDESGIGDFGVNTDSLLQGLSPSFITTILSKEQLREFGFETIEELKQFPKEVQDNLQMGMKLFYLLEPVFKVNPELDASCCAILFCKALELQMKDCFVESLKALFSHEKMHGKTLSAVETEKITLGALRVLLDNKSPELGKRMEQKGEPKYNTDWWIVFKERLKKCTDNRNKCCHSGLFSWESQLTLQRDIFLTDDPSSKMAMRGLLFESRIGKIIQ